jgi:hypothetical protein
MVFLIVSSASAQETCVCVSPAPVEVDTEITVTLCVDGAPTRIQNAESVWFHTDIDDWSEERFIAEFTVNEFGQQVFVIDAEALSMGAVDVWDSHWDIRHQIDMESFVSGGDCDPCCIGPESAMPVGGGLGLGLLAGSCALTGAVSIRRRK